jgi:dGTPase
VADVRNAPPLVTFSAAMQDEAAQLKRFLRRNLYQHYQVNRMTSKARRVVVELFQVFMGEPGLLPPDYQTGTASGPALAPPEMIIAEQARKVSDYIAGMTDRYAMREHRRLFTVGEI